MTDLEIISAKFLTWGKDGAAIFGALSRLKAAYLRLSPVTRASLAADEQALVAQWNALDRALTAYNREDGLSQASGLMEIGNTLAMAVPVLTRVARDSATVFGADWTVIQPDITLIVTTLKGSAS
jgi:hypothetical protein